MREPWPLYFMGIAEQVARRSTCDRLRVGAVITLDNRILSTGYNGSAPGQPHCDEAGHDMLDGHCVRTIHAEINSIATSARMGIRIDGATMYVTHSPCYSCLKVIKGSGIKLVYFKNPYRVDGVRMRSMSKYPPNLVGLISNGTFFEADINLYSISI